MMIMGQFGVIPGTLPHAQNSKGLQRRGQGAPPLARSTLALHKSYSYLADWLTGNLKC